jgi:hypothetical protein
MRRIPRSFRFTNYFLGPATYVMHQSELPMAVTWRLKHASPVGLFAEFAAVVA